jgi:hypothetical protein
MNGRWGKFSNARGDKFSAGFVMSDGTIFTNTLAIDEDCQGMDTDDKMKVFQRVNERMLSCYALESWKYLNWIEDLWHGLLDELRGQADYASALLSFSEQPTPEETSYSWVPIHTISAYCPELYALPARYFSEIPNTASLFIKCLSTMSRMQHGLLPLFHEAILHQIFALGYQNVHEIMQGTEPYQFNMRTYKDALKQNDLTDRMRLLKQDDWLPGDGDYLGALHYLYALGKLEQGYQDTLTSNEHRRGKALFLCRTLQHCPIPGFPTHLESGMKHLGYFTDDDNLQILQRFIMEISQFLSLFARICRWETRSSGCLEHFITQAKNIVGDSNQFESVFGYLLYIGKEIFGFYLLLWEAVLRTDYNTGGKNVYL